MKLAVSDKVASSTKKPKIKKGYYTGRLLQVKPRQDKDGNWIESKFGRQIILLFEIFQEGKKIMNPDNPSEPMILSQVLNSEYKNKDGKFSTAVTPNSRITKVFKDLGWVFSTAGLDIDQFIGKSCELNIDDYEVTDTDGNKYKASCIKDTNPLEGEEPSSPSPIIETPKEIKKQLSSVQIEKIKKLTKMNDVGLLSEEGLKKAIEQIENGN